ncbi:MAG: hypothetical protein ACYSX0_11940, partial [Planctomycetota bacterium]
HKSAEETAKRLVRRMVENDLYWVGPDGNWKYPLGYSAVPPRSPGFVKAWQKRIDVGHANDARDIEKMLNAHFCDDDWEALEAED